MMSKIYPGHYREKCSCCRAKETLIHIAWEYHAIVKAIRQTHNPKPEGWETLLLSDTLSGQINLMDRCVAAAHVLAGALD